MKDRVRQVQEHYKLSQKQFANQLCVAEATISNIYRGRVAPSNNLIQAVHQFFPAVNVNWLMFGEGEMLLPLSPSDCNHTTIEPSAELDSRYSSGADLLQKEGVGAAVTSPSQSGRTSGAKSSPGNYQESEGPSLFSMDTVGDVPNVGLHPQASSASGEFSGSAVGGKDHPQRQQNQPSYDGLLMAEVLTELKKVNNVDKMRRKIREIRVFYDDGTYESFVPSSK